MGSIQIREQDFDVDHWKQSLGPLTWTEILWQVLVAAGFGSKQKAIRRGNYNEVLQTTNCLIFVNIGLNICCSYASFNVRLEFLILKHLFRIFTMHVLVFTCYPSMVSKFYTSQRKRFQFAYAFPKQKLLLYI